MTLAPAAVVTRFWRTNLAVVAGVVTAAAVLAGAPPPPVAMLDHTLVLVPGPGSSLVSVMAAFRSPFLPALRAG